MKKISAGVTVVAIVTLGVTVVPQTRSILAMDIPITNVEIQAAAFLLVASTLVAKGTKGS